jgi:hypothetical protein
MATTYKLISSVTVGSGSAASIDFTSIPSTYTDLLLRYSLRSNRGIVVDGINISFNGSTSNFTGVYLEGSGSTAISSTSTRFAGVVSADTSTASTFGNGDIYIPNYTGSKNKSFSGTSVSENNSTAAYADFNAVLWSDSAAITSISVTPFVGTLFYQYSTAYLYGISNA